MFVYYIGEKEKSIYFEIEFPSLMFLRKITKLSVIIGYFGVVWAAFSYDMFGCYMNISLHEVQVVGSLLLISWPCVSQMGSIFINKYNFSGGLN